MRIKVFKINYQYLISIIINNYQHLYIYILFTKNINVKNI